MRTALVRLVPEFEVIEEFNGMPKVLSIPGVGNVHAAAVGHKAGGYQLVEVVRAEDRPHRFVDPRSETLSLNGDVLTKTRNYAAKSLDYVKARLASEIEQKADIRINTLAQVKTMGQWVITLWRAAELLKFETDGAPVAKNYPVLMSASGDLGSDVGAAAAAAKTAQDEMVGTISAVWKVRTEAIATMYACATIEEAIAAFDGILWP